jgi:hypothetical protein
MPTTHGCDLPHRWLVSALGGLEAMIDQSRYQTFAEMDLSAVDINAARPGSPVMTTHQASCPTATSAGERAASLFDFFKSLTKGISSWVQSTADLWAAATLHDALRRLSDAELHKRGFSRDTLVRDVLQSGAHIARG